MKKLFPYCLIILLAACSEDPVVVITPDPGPTIHVNFYSPNSSLDEYAPHLTIKDEAVQVIGFGYNYQGIMLDIDKLYLSDTKTSTEWVILVGDHNKPEFMYGYNSSTKQKLPSLYWIDNQEGNAYTLKYYSYDWDNRLGTLLYEARIDNGVVDLIFENSSYSPGERVGKSSISYPVPIPGFGLHGSRSLSAAKQAALMDETLDEMFDRKANELMDLLKDTKTKLIDAPCQVSEALRNIDRGFVCDLSEELNRITDEKIFDDFSNATQEDQNSNEEQVYEGSNINFNIDFFDDINLVEDLSRHLNDIRDNFADNIQRLQDWYDEFNENTEVETADLNDLTDASGVIQIGLSWNTTADIDLHVTDPYGEEINYTNPSSESGGYLDRDDTDGFGPENIYWTENIPDGTYSVSIVYYGPSDGPSTDFTLKVINGLGDEKAFTGSVGYFEENPVHIVTFTKSGNRLNF